MRRIIAIALFVAALMTTIAVAQSATDLPKWQLGLGYNYVHANQPPGQCACFSMNGGQASVAFVANSKFSVLGEFIGVTNGNVNSSGLNLNLFTYLVGPRYTYRKTNSKVNPFGQVLIGGAHGSGGLYSTSNGFSGSSNGFAMTAGGGLDVKANQRVSIRVFQADYLLTLLANGKNDTQNNFSFSAGVVFNFGKH